MKTILLLLITILFINTTSAQLQANFRCSGCGFDGGDIGFTDMSIQGSNPIILWHWDFGNGDSINMQNPTCVTFDSVGTYTICLTVFDAFGNYSLKCKQNYIITDLLGTHCNILSNLSNFTHDDFINYYNSGLNLFSINTDFTEVLEFQFYDDVSRILVKNNFKNNLTVSTESFAPGIYFYSIKSKDGRKYSGKIVVQH